LKPNKEIEKGEKIYGRGVNMDKEMKINVEKFTVSKFLCMFCQGVFNEAGL